MSTIKVDVSSSKKPVLQVGYQEENEVTDVLFDISAWVEEYGGGTAGLRVKRPQNSEEESYELSLPISEDVATWTISETDTFNKGNGKVQLKYYVGSALKRSAVYTYKVGKSIVGSDNPVDPFDTWIERSKAWATGELLDGEDVPASDETYHNNAKYYAEQSGTQAEEAEAQAVEAKAQADAAKQYAHQFVGAPRAASTSSSMTDHSLIYVFTGTTTSSLTNGHWYYWNGSAWTDGGVYNSTAFTTDTTLSVSGAAADAKVVGGLKEELTNYNAFDIFSMLPVPNAGSHNGITFTWSKNSCAVSGTSTANAFLNFYYNLTELPDGVIAGCDYVVKYNTTNLNVTLVLYFYDANGSLISSGSRYITGDTSVHIPDNAVGMIARIQVSANTTVNISVIYHMINTKTNTELSKACDKLNNSIYGTKIDILSIFGNFEKTVHNGITFTPISNGFEINGTSNNAAYTNIYYDYTSLMQGLNPGDNLHFVSDGIVSGVQWSVGFFDSNQAFIQPTRYITGNTYITVPSNAVGMYVRLNVASGITLTNTKTTAKLFIVKSNKYYGIEQYNKVTQTSNGITYEWDESSSRYYIHGTANAASFYNMWHDFYSLPAGINPGDKILITFNSENIHIAVAVMFYDSSRNILQSKTYVHSGVISVPSNSVGMTFRFTIYNSYTANDYIYIPTLSEFLTRADVVPVSIGKPKYISFIDDDTSTDTYVDRYYQACMHNGIKGAYAVCTKQYTDEINNLEKLKQYEAEGFNLCLHCDSQERYLQPTSSEYNEAEARKNYIRAINAFRTLGLINCRNSWIIPYGSMSDVNIKIAKDLNFDVAFTTYGDVYNTIYDNNVYTLRRTGLSSSGDVTDDTNVSELGTMARCKARVNELANSDEGGWLVIMTHFNEWDDMTWNSNTDNDGYQIGYARFNEFVQYALSAGLTPISISEGVAYMKPLIERNVTRG